MNDTLVVGSCLVIAMKVLVAFGIYMVLVTFFIRMISSRWHPDGGQS